MSVGGIRAGRAYVELGVSDKLTAGLRRAQARMRIFGAALQRLGATITAGSAAIIAPMTSAVLRFASAGDAIAKAARRIGMTTVAMAELGYAAEQSGIGAEALEVSMRNMQRLVGAVAAGIQADTSALDALGVSARTLVRLAPDEQLAVLADRFARIGDPAARVALAMRIFGRSGSQMLPLLAGGAAGIARLRERARTLGRTLGAEAGASAERLNDALNDMRSAWRGLAMSLGGAFAPALAGLFEQLAVHVGAVARVISAHRTWVLAAGAVAATMAALGAAIVAVGLVVSAASMTLGVFVSAVSAVGVAVKAGAVVMGTMLAPISAVSTALGGLAATMGGVARGGARAFAWLRDRVGSVASDIGDMVSAMAEALAAGRLDLAARVLWAGLRAVWNDGVDSLALTWMRLRVWLLANWYEFSGAAMKIMGRIWPEWRKQWVELTSWLAVLWAESAASLRSIYGTATNWVTKQLIRVFGMLDDRVDIAAAQAMADAEYADQMRNIEAARRAQLEQIERDRIDAISRAAQAMRDEASGVADAERRAIVAAEREALARMEADRSAVSDAQRRFRAALDEARRAANARKRGLEPDGGAAPGVDADTIWRGLDVARRITSGSFNPFIASRIGASDPQERTARNTTEMVRYLRRIAEHGAPVYE